MSRRPGAPPGGRVHWLLLHLSEVVKRAYKVHYDYTYHNYLFARYPTEKMFGYAKPLDIFIVVRTSKRCFRCMYYHREYKYFEYFSCKTSKEIAEKIEKLYLKIRKSENKENKG